MSNVYLLDTNTFRVFAHYYPDAFPSFWADLETLVDNHLMLSCSEVYKEIDYETQEEHLLEWAENHTGIFEYPSGEEMQAVAEIFKIKHFQQLIGEKQRIRGRAVADPFLVAKGICSAGTVVTEEGYKPNSAKIPNICEHFNVRCIKAREFLVECKLSY